MKISSTTFILFFIVFSMTINLPATGQEIFYCGYTDDGDMGDRLCNFRQQSSFTSNADAEKAVDMLLAPVGLPRSFVLVSCPRINNAIAITPDDGLRYIVYDNEFISRIGDGKSDWAALSILAHELGHHLCGHTLRASQSIEEQRKKELQADDWSGFILQKLGATLEQAQFAVNENASEGDDSYSTHPNKSKRLASVKTGYDRARGNKEPDYLVTTPSAESYFNDGNKYFSTDQFADAVKAYTKAVEYNPSFAQAYYNRGQVKKALQDNEGAITDFSLAINLKPGFAEAHNYRGQLSYKRGNYTNALSDLNTAITNLATPDPLAFFYRGLCKRKLNDLQGAYSDLTNAIMIEPRASFYLNRGLVRFDLGDLTGAIDDYSEAISLKPELSLAYFNRASARLILEDYQGAIQDLEIYLTKEPSDEGAMYNLGICYLNLNEDDQAIEQFTKLINLNPNYAKAYHYRGLAYKKLQKYQEAIDDYNQAVNLNYFTSELYFNKGNANYSLKNYGEAINDLTKSIELDRENTGSIYLRGLIYQITGEDAKACSDFSQACLLGYEAGCMDKSTLCN